MDKLSELYQKGVSRRNFLAGAGALGAASVLAGCSDSGTSTVVPPPTGFTDADILNFALNLEYVEAEFYLYAATGQGLSAADAGTGAATTTVPATTKLTGLSSAQQAIVNEIAYDEQSHVQFLRKALGSAAVPRPAIDLTFFGPLAMVAGITTAATGTGSFTPFSDFNAFLIGGFIFEDVGVTAYNGAAGLLTSTDYLSAAAGILAVEAYHAGSLRTMITGQAIALGSTAYPYLTYANKVIALRATLGGGNETMLTLPASISSASSIVAADTTNAIAFHRTVDQVLHIVYGSPTVGVAKGGFLPNGANGYFKTTTT